MTKCRVFPQQPRCKDYSNTSGFLRETAELKIKQQSLYHLIMNQHCRIPDSSRQNDFFSSIHGSLFSNNGNSSLPHNPDFKRPRKRRLLKTLWEKEKMLVPSIFSLSHNVFYPFRNKFQFLSPIHFVVCKCFQFAPVYKVVV